MSAAPARPGSKARAGGEPLSLGVLDEVLGFHIARARLVTVDTFDRHVAAPLGLKRVEYSLLLLLRANADPGVGTGEDEARDGVSAKRLAQALSLSAPTLTMLLDRLESRDLVRRERSATDRRRQNVRLTAAGAALAERAAAVAPPMEAELDARLGPAERRKLIALLAKLVR